MKGLLLVRPLVLLLWRLVRVLLLVLILVLLLLLVLVVVRKAVRVLRRGTSRFRCVWGAGKGTKRLVGTNRGFSTLPRSGKRVKKK